MFVKKLIICTFFLLSTYSYGHSCPNLFVLDTKEIKMNLSINKILDDLKRNFPQLSDVIQDTQHTIQNNHIKFKWSDNHITAFEPLSNSIWLDPDMLNEEYGPQRILIAIRHELVHATMPPFISNNNWNKEEFLSAYVSFLGKNEVDAFLELIRTSTLLKDLNVTPYEIFPDYLKKSVELIQEIPSKTSAKSKLFIRISRLQTPCGTTYYELWRKFAENVYKTNH